MLCIAEQKLLSILPRLEGRMPDMHYVQYIHACKCMSTGGVCDGCMGKAHRNRCYILNDFHLNHSVAQLVEMKIIQNTILFMMSFSHASITDSSCSTLVTVGPHNPCKLKCM